MCSSLVATRVQLRFTWAEISSNETGGSLLVTRHVFLFWERRTAPGSKPPNFAMNFLKVALLRSVGGIIEGAIDTRLFYGCQMVRRTLNFQTLHPRNFRTNMMPMNGPFLPQKKGKAARPLFLGGAILSLNFREDSRYIQSLTFWYSTLCAKPVGTSNL